MEYYLLALLLIPLPTFVVRSEDPAPGIFQTRADARAYACANLGQSEAHELYPVQVPEPAARQIEGSANVLVCTRTVLAPDERRPRDEAVLGRLGTSVNALLQAVLAVSPPGLRWHVDGFYPDDQVAQKLAVASRVTLAERGERVSDAVPVLTAGDVAVISPMPAAQAYPLACARYFVEGLLKDDDAFLGIMILDARETQLHAGTCIHGTWRWIR